jgi:hypothetical protein
VTISCHRDNNFLDSEHQTWLRQTLIWLPHIFRCPDELGSVAIQPQLIFSLLSNACVHGIDIRTTDQFTSTLGHDQSIMNSIDIDLDGFEALGKDFNETFDPYLQFIAASGKVNFEYPDLPAAVDTPVSTINMSASSVGDATAYNLARTARPLSLTSLPRDTRNKIYAMVLGPPSQVAIQSIHQAPFVRDWILPPTSLFLVSSKVHREAASLFYGGIEFHLETEWGISYMTGRMGLDNCRDVRSFTTFMQYVSSIRLTLRTVFPHLETLTVIPNDGWFNGPWFNLLHKKHGGYFQAAIDEAVVTSETKAAFGLREILDMSRHYDVAIKLPFWNNANTLRVPVVVRFTTEQRACYLCMTNYLGTGYAAHLEVSELESHSLTGRTLQIERWMEG